MKNIILILIATLFITSCNNDDTGDYEGNMYYTDLFDYAPDSVSLDLHFHSNKDVFIYDGYIAIDYYDINDINGEEIFANTKIIAFEGFESTDPIERYPPYILNQEFQVFTNTDNFDLAKVTAVLQVAPLEVDRFTSDTIYMINPFNQLP